MFTLKEDAGFERFYQTYQQWGGVMQIFLVEESTAADPMDAAAHQRMAAFAMRHLQEQHHADGWEMSFKEDILWQTAPVRLSADQFFGFCFDWRTRRVRVRGDCIPFLNNYFYHDEPQNEQTATNYYGTPDTAANRNRPFPEKLAEHRRIQQLPPYRKTDFSAKSYTDAFLDPPYGFGIYHDETVPGLARRSGREQAAFFLMMTTHLFGDFGSLFICEHTVDCSSFFDYGKEYWGSYLWTVYSPARRHWIGLAVSATD